MATVHPFKPRPRHRRWGPIALVSFVVVAFLAGGVAGEMWFRSGTPAPERLVDVVSARAATSRPARSQIQGVPRVVDGDTIVVAGIHVRLDGVDAEETDHGPGKPAEPHGDAARAVMQEIVGVGASVQCELNGKKSYDRLIGVCVNARGQDIGGELIRRGMALDCARFSGGRYRALEPAGARARLIQKPYCS